MPAIKEALASPFDRGLFNARRNHLSRIGANIRGDELINVNPILLLGPIPTVREVAMAGPLWRSPARAYNEMKVANSNDGLLLTLNTNRKFTFHGRGSRSIETRE